MYVNSVHEKKNTFSTYFGTTHSGAKNVSLFMHFMGCKLKGFQDILLDGYSCLSQRKHDLVVMDLQSGWEILKGTFCTIFMLTFRTSWPEQPCFSSSGKKPYWILRRRDMTVCCHNYGPVTPATYSTIAIAWTIAWTSSCIVIAIVGPIATA